MKSGAPRSTGLTGIAISGLEDLGMAESFEPWFTLELTVKEGQEAAFLEIFKDRLILILGDRC